eukprot:TRINITY_DN38277_c0_g1_i1.p2 TRINITY_DN38277_c0_g1~~TRINITY_DN38277_c0_g1_i1.p2  ORF type:complete len:451 (+),score=117.86 TRINITY_DN38277_c0_g1_i1:26-1354(+)
MPRAVVVGGGAIRVSTAYELLQRGFAVTLVERKGGVARAGSFQNGNHMNDTWSPIIPGAGLEREFLLSVQGKGQFLPWDTKLRSTLGSAAFLRWLGLTLELYYGRRSEERRAELSRAGTALLRLTHARVRALDELHAELAAQPRRQGVVSLLYESSALEAARARGVPVLSRDELAAKEPALWRLCDPQKLVGGALCEGCRLMDCQGYTEALAAVCAAQGLEALTDTQADAVLTQGGKARGVATRTAGGGARRIEADVVVICAGMHTPALLSPLAPPLPILPVSGYSLDWPAPVWGAHGGGRVLRSYGKLYLVRGLGLSQRPCGRLRIDGLVRFRGMQEHHAEDPRLVARVLSDRVRRRAGISVERLLPADLSTASAWGCTRPVTPDNLPIIGECGARGLYVSSGHSFSGWGWSLGSARLLAAMVAGERLPVDAAPFSPARWA